MTGTPDTSKINKGALYRAFDRVAVIRRFEGPNPEYRCLYLDYGDANEAQIHRWECNPGKEYTVFSPWYNAQLKEDIITLISGAKFKANRHQSHHGAILESNPLASLPETVIFGITKFLDNLSLLNLCCASFSTFLSLRDDTYFWKTRIRNHLPYFFELHECLSEHSQILMGRDFRKIFLWAEAASKPRPNVAKFMFPIANRRRIWRVCEQIDKLYTQEPRQKLTSQSYIGSQAIESAQLSLGDTREPGLYFRSADLLRNWHELLHPWTLNLFWNSEADLSGIAVSIGEDLRIFGFEPQGKESGKTTASFLGGVWIKGFVFHIYASSILGPWETRSWNYSSCKGVTVHLTDGSEYTYGQDGQHLLKMPFAAAENMTIVGIKGSLTAHKRPGVHPFVEKISLLQARTNGGENPSETPELRAHEGLCWNAANCIFNSIFSPGDDLRLKICKGRVLDSERWQSIVPLNTLVLANDTNELSQIRSISAYLIRDKFRYSDRSNHCCDVGNLRVAAGEETRYLRDTDDDGSIWPEQRWDTFEIDGPGGERIEEFRVHHVLGRDSSPEAIEIRTNWGRSVLWGVDMKPGKDGEFTNGPAPLVKRRKPPTHLRADYGHVIVGVVMGCGKVYGRWFGDKVYGRWHKDMSIDEQAKALEKYEISVKWNSSSKDYIEDKDVGGPWTKEQYDRRNEATLHTGMTNFGIIIRRITD
ncbi:hypothetical protein V3481_012895 [Fusarium oxysporum f. sp. vasinfectum]